MKVSWLAGCSLILAACSTSTVETPPKEHDYAIFSAEPYQTEVELGVKRLGKFLSRRSAGREALLRQTPYVAVQVYQLTAGEIPQIVRRLNGGKLASDAFFSDTHNSTAAPVHYVLLFDHRTQEVLNHEGFLITNEPKRNSIATFGSTRAIYAGTE